MICRSQQFKQLYQTYAKRRHTAGLYILHLIQVHCTYKILLLLTYRKQPVVCASCHLRVTIPKHFIPSTPSTSPTHLDEFLHCQSRQHHCVIGDGNCLFSVISHQLYATEDLHIQLRQSLHRYIDQHQSEYEVYWIDSTISYSQYFNTTAYVPRKLGYTATLFFLPSLTNQSLQLGKVCPINQKKLTIRRGIALLPAFHCWSHRNRTQQHKGSIVSCKENSLRLQAPIITPRVVASICLVP